MSRPRIVLTMIVKDESAVIARCLRSVRDHIDAWAICDTGSSDDTKTIIQRELEGIPGVLLDRPWVDFATNRNEAIEAAQQFTPDYLLTIDADERLETKPGFSLRELNHENYAAKFQVVGTSHTWPRRLLVKPENRYAGVLDEHFVGNDDQALLPCCVVHSGTDGARSSLGLVDKFRRDSEVYREALKTEPENARYWFYFGQRLSGCGEYAEAIQAYQRRLELNGFGEEAYYSKFMIAQCRDQLEEPWVDVARSYQDAYNELPTRAEPLFAIGCLHARNGEFQLAEMYFRQAQRLPRPQASLLIDESVYAWRAADHLIGVIAEQGRLAEARDLLVKLRALPQVPADEYERIDENIADLNQALEDETVKARTMIGADEHIYDAQGEAIREKGLRGFRQLARDYLASYQAQSLPSPARWLWVTLVAFCGRWATIVPAAGLPFVVAWALVPVFGLSLPVAAVAAASPLLWLTGKRRFQDPLVALLTLGILGFALRGEPLAMGAAIAVLLCVKEAGVFALPAAALAWYFSGGDWAAFGASVAGGCAVAAASVWAIFGEMALPMVRAGARGHATPYTADNQVGAPHRLIVDLLLVSPVVTIVSVASGQLWVLGLALLLVAAHTLAPVRNVRLILAAELLLRSAVAASLGWWALPLVAVDLFIIRKLRDVYDPVTAALTQGLGMSK